MNARPSIISVLAFLSVVMPAWPAAAEGFVLHVGFRGDASDFQLLDSPGEIRMARPELLGEITPCPDDQKCGTAESTSSFRKWMVLGAGYGRFRVEAHIGLRAWSSDPDDILEKRYAVGVDALKFERSTGTVLVYWDRNHAQDITHRNNGPQGFLRVREHTTYGSKYDVAYRHRFQFDNGFTLGAEFAYGIYTFNTWQGASDDYGDYAAPGTAGDLRIGLIAGYDLQF